MAKEIVVVQAGWVFIGDVQSTDSGLEMTKASVVRVWGTTAGLGELAIKGPTKDTVLDYAGEITVPMSAVLCRIKCKV